MVFDGRVLEGNAGVFSGVFYIYIQLDGRLILGCITWSSSTTTSNDSNIKNVPLITAGGMTQPYETRVPACLHPTNHCAKKHRAHNMSPCAVQPLPNSCA